MKAKRSMSGSFGNQVVGRYGKWMTLSIWVAVALVLNVLLPQAGQFANDTAESLSDTMPSSQAQAVIEQQFADDASLPALIVWHRAEGLSDDDLQHIQQAAGKLAEHPLPDQLMIPPIHQIPLQGLRMQVSENGTSLIMPVLFDSEADADRLKENIFEMERLVETTLGFSPFANSLESGELLARVTGPVGILIDATELFSAGDLSLTIATFLFVLVVLLLIYRSPILAFIPLVGVGFAYSVLSPILGWLGREGILTYDSQGIAIMTVLLFGAGTDYCLFLIARFRQLLQEEARPGAALLRALKDKGGPLAMSALTTVFAMALLLLANYGPIERFAIPFVLAIALAGLASLTVVPALLAIIGRASFYPFIPKTADMIAEEARRKSTRVRIKPESSKLSSRLGTARGGALSGSGNRARSGWLSSFVVNRARIVAVVSIAVLVIVAGFALQTKYTYDTLSSFPENMPSRQGFALMGDAFSPGQLAPVKVMVELKESGMRNQAEQTIIGHLSSLPYVSRVTGPDSGMNDERIRAFQVELTMNPYSNEAMDTIPLLRQEATEALTAAGVASDGQQIWIGGQTAVQYDIRETSNQDAYLLVPLIILIIAVLLLIYLRSAVAMLYLMLSNLLSYFTALGMGWLIIHHVMGADAIQGFIPLYAFIFLGALGVDYNIFMVSSIWKNARTMPLKEAIKEGVSETGSVINSAGIILAGTFAVLATLPIQILVHFGVITAVGVLIDTFIVRPFVVPALTAWLGEKSFWPGPIPRE